MCFRLSVLNLKKIHFAFIYCYVRIDKITFWLLLANFRIPLISGYFNSFWGGGLLFFYAYFSSLKSASNCPFRDKQGLWNYLNFQDYTTKNSTDFTGSVLHERLHVKVDDLAYSVKATFLYNMSHLIPFSKDFLVSLWCSESTFMCVQLVWIEFLWHPVSQWIDEVPIKLMTKIFVIMFYTAHYSPCWWCFLYELKLQISQILQLE